MTPKETLKKWIKAFNNCDVEGISNLYSDDAINHQVPNSPIIGKEAIKKMFETEFSNADMNCIPENIFEDGQWAILEWKDPNGLRGCGFFQIQNNKIKFQRGYWDKLTFLKLQENKK
ncbi:MAG: steroid delta-isomerase [Marinilabiliales bacterium]|nr:MAG: steroid delta-isomerase [Marinilabiliales bacterium]